MDMHSMVYLGAKQQEKDTVYVRFLSCFCEYCIKPDIKMCYNQDIAGKYVKKEYVQKKDQLNQRNYQKQKEQNLIINIQYIIIHIIIHIIYIEIICNIFNNHHILSNNILNSNSFIAKYQTLNNWTYTNDKISYSNISNTIS